MMPVTIAPALQGWATDTLSWSWIFLLSLPFGVVGLLSLLLPVRERPRRAHRLDWAGATLLGIAMVCLVFVLQERSEEHTSELQSLMRNSYAVFCLKKKQ